MYFMYVYKILRGVFSSIPWILDLKVNLGVFCIQKYMLLLNLKCSH